MTPITACPDPESSRLEMVRYTSVLSLTKWLTAFQAGDAGHSQDAARLGNGV